MSLIYRSTLAVGAISAYAAAQQGLWHELAAQLREPRELQTPDCMAYEYGPNPNSALQQNTAACTEYAPINAVFDSFGVGWRPVIQFDRTDDDWDLVMINIMFSGDAPSNKIDKTNAKPVLLVHGVNTNFWSWFDRNDNQTDWLPVRLANDGFDVYLYMRAGDTFQQKRFTSSNPNIPLDPNDLNVANHVAFWDITNQSIGNNHFEKLVEGIIQDRQSFEPETDCSKVTIVGHSFGTNESLIALNNDEAPKYVDKLINLTPCAIANIDYFPTLSQSRRRNLLSAAQENDLKQASKDAKDELGNELYREFYLALRAKIMSDIAAWNADWETIFEECLAIYQAQRCTPEPPYTPDPNIVLGWFALINAIRLSLFGFRNTQETLFGPNYTDQLSNFANALPSGTANPTYQYLDSFSTCYFGGHNYAYPACTPEIGINLILSGMQAAWYKQFTTFDDDWANSIINNTPPTVYDFSNWNTIPTYNHYVMGDAVCDVATNIPIFEEANEVLRIVWNDGGRTHSNLAGSNDAAFYSTLKGQISGREQAAVCTTFGFIFAPGWPDASTKPGN